MFMVHRRLNKGAKLCSKKQIEQLFAKGQSIRSLSFTCLYTVVPFEGEREQHQIAVSVAKGRKVRAVKRNSYKRKIREAYRIVREEVLPEPQELQKKILMFFLCYPKSDTTTMMLQEEMKELLNKLREMV